MKKLLVLFFVMVLVAPSLVSAQPIKESVEEAPAYFYIPYEVQGDIEISLNADIDWAYSTVSGTTIFINDKVANFTGTVTFYDTDGNDLGTFKLIMNIVVATQRWMVTIPQIGTWSLQI